MGYLPMCHDEVVLHASSITVLTGAGVSAESNIPTFRGTDGLWKQYRAEDLATPQAFARDPRLVWEWYDLRRQMISRAEPNPGHYALAQLEKRTPHFTLITQNVDDLHERAGSQHILKVHGDIFKVRCTGCGKEHADKRVPLPEIPPHCECGHLLRPGVVWFGEGLPQDVWLEAGRATQTAEVFLVVGTSAIVYPVAGLVELAKTSGARVIEINPEETPISRYADTSLRGRAGELLPQLIA